MSAPDVDDGQDRPDTTGELAALRAENAALRAQLHGTGRSRRGWGWAVPSAVLITIGALLAPVAVLSSWAGREVTSTDAFVATYAPLVRDEAVRSFVATKTIAVVDEHVDVRALTGTVFDGIRDLDLPPRAKTALGTLEAPAAAGVENLITSTVHRFVDSPQFATLWERLLRTAHTQVNATLRGDRDADVAIAADGSIGIQLGPVVSAVKQRLLDDGLTLASRIPAVDRTIVIATSDAAVRAQTAYTLVQLTATWLPWAVVAFVAVGVLMARRRARALTAAAVGVAAAMVATILAVAVGRVLAVRALAPDLMPRNAARVVYDSTVAFVLSAAVAGVVLALSVAIVAWFAGSSRSAVRLRGACTRAASALRDAGDRRGWTTGSVGVALYRGRVLVRTLVALGAAAIIALHRPLEPSVIVWTLVGALVVVALVEVLGRPVPAVFSPASDDPPPTARP